MAPDTTLKQDPLAPLPASPSSTTDERHGKLADLAIRALRNRPKFSIRMQTYLAVILSLIFLMSIAGALLVVTYTIERKVHLLEVSNNYLFEMQQARRFEKNYFLYKSNLEDAIESTHSARRILRENAEALANMAGRQTVTAILSHLDQYEQLLQELEVIERDLQASDYFWKKKDAESQVRKHGQEMIALTQDLMQQEKSSLDKMILLSRWVHVFSFVFLFVLFAVNTMILGRRVLAPLRRFMSYAERIAGGDYTPIMPARKYRDEFSNLAIAINQMIMELERRQNILVQSHKLRAIGTLTAGVAHELNNPINNISLTVHMMKEDYRQLSDEARLVMVDDLIGEVERTKKIVSNLLDFARESESSMEPLDLENVIHETLALAGNQIALVGIRIDLNVMPHLPRVHGDHQQLEQVFLNLILNAIDVTSKGGRLQILVIPADEPNFVAVKVTDYGPGIPEHILPSIFDPFFTTKPKGTGLGLSICQGIVAKHGGHIKVDTKPNVGTTFTVFLPITTFPAKLDQMKSSS